MPKIFIGMPVYNGERFIREAIDSIINQSYENWELFISDDASTDATAEISKEYSVRDARIVYKRQEKNIGVYPNFKFVLDKADRDYFMWAAHDDIREKDYIKTCFLNLEKDKNLGLATTTLAVIDSLGQNIKEEPDLVTMSGSPGVFSVARYVLQPEILGKCNLVYSLFRTEVAKKAWQIYPLKTEWGTDYHFALALVSHFNIFVDNSILFKKRRGGLSSPKIIKNTNIEKVKTDIIKNPKNHMFPFGRFRSYFIGHMKALQKTPYRLLVAIILLIRLPRSFFIYLREKL